MVSRLRAPISALLLGLLASCTGAIGEGNGNPGTGAATGTGGNTSGTGGANPAGVGGATGSAGAGGVPAAPGLQLDGKPIFSRYIRLTHEQWENTVRDLL